MATYDIDGQKYDCHMFTPLVCGEDRCLQTRLNGMSPESIADDYCKSCVQRHRVVEREHERR